MRRSRVNSASLASASIAVHTLSQLHHHPETTHSQRLSPRQRQRKILRLGQGQRQNLNFIRLLAVVAVIATPCHCALGTTTTASTTSTTTTTTTSTSVSIQNISNNNNTENNFYFDEHNKTKAKTITFIPGSDTLTTIPDIGQMPDVETTTIRAQVGQIVEQQLVTTRRPSRPSMKTETFGIINNSTTIKTYSTGSFDLLLATSAATTTKSARSTVKQPNDSTKSRNHWTFGGAVDAERSRTFRNKYHHENHYGPFFEEPSNLIDPGKTLVAAVHLFTEAVLNCRVGMLKDKTVMWVRRTTEKVSLLTVGNVTYSGDPRIRVKFQYPNNWRLLINPTQREDAGIYMCQVSTHPPRVFTTNLTILEPPLRIIDEHERDVGDRYYKSGSTVDLQCQISRNFFQKEHYNIFKTTDSGSPNSKLNDTDSELNLNLISDANQTHTKTFSSQELEKYFSNFITWAKDEEPLQALTNRRFSVSDKWLTSRISIPDAKLSDSGNYSCSLGRLFTVIVQVQVLTGELPAAVQHNLARRSASCFLLSWSLFIIVICFYILKNHSSQFHYIQMLSA